jgi:hypothetical protein
MTMAHLGILLTFDHYPVVRPCLRGIDRQFLNCLSEAGHKVSQVSVFDLSQGVPQSPPECDLWVVSGTPDVIAASSPEVYHDILRWLRGLNERSHVYALNHGEHVLHDALCSAHAAPPSTSRTPNLVRNPFWSFWRRDRLYAVRADRAVAALPRFDTDVTTQPCLAALGTAR